MMKIRRYRKDDADAVMRIWLRANLQAHSFIPERYWRENESLVKNQYLPASETYVCETGRMVEGFLSITDGNFIGGLFVSPESQSRGIGAKLIAAAQRRFPALTLAVYCENIRAVRFYERCGFRILEERNSDTPPHREYLMGWNDTGAKGER